MATKDALADAVAGVAGSLVAMFTFYPIDVIKTNLQAGKGNECKNKGSNDEADDQYKIIRSLFRGLHLKAAHTTASSFAYFYIYSWIKTKHRILHLRNKKNGGKYQPSTTARLLLAAIAGCCNVTLTLPLDVLAARSQTHVSEEEKTDDGSKSTEEEGESSESQEDHTEGMGGNLKEIASHEVAPNVIMEEVWRNVGEQHSDDDYDTAHEDMNDECLQPEDNGTCEDEHNCKDSCKSHRSNRDHDNNSNLKNTEHIISHYPQRIDNQPNFQGPSFVRPIFRIDSMNQPFPKQLVFALTLLKHKSNKNKLHKVMELWRGIGPSLLLCSNPSINFTVFDTLKDHVLRHKTKNNITSRLNLGEAFVLGIIAKFAATIVTYPLIRAKIMLMVAKRNDCCEADSSNENTMIKVLRDMFKEGGIGELYKGCRLQLLHTLLKSALMMMVRERITSNIRRLVLSK